MFTGIIKGQGRIIGVEERGGDRRLTLDTGGVELGAIVAGDSIAVNGVCLTAIDPSAQLFSADVSRETLSRTTLGRLKAGDRVNLEPSFRVGEPIAGHFVYGHVDAVGEVTEMRDDARSVVLGIAAPAALGRYIAVKGSITVDGVSLTVNSVDGSEFKVNIIPHTRDITNISDYRVGTPVNIEVDMIARYLERLAASDSNALSRDTLKSHGFIRSD